MDGFSKKYLWKLLIYAAIVALLWMFFRFLLPFVAPFIAALLMARLMEPLILKLHAPRRLLSAVLTLLVTGTIAGLLAVIISAVLSELSDLAAQLPKWISRLPEASAAWGEQANIWIQAAPVSLQDFLRTALDRLLNESFSIPSDLYKNLVGWLSSAALALPGAMLFLAAGVLATYFISSDYPRVVKTLLSPFPPRVREKVLRVKELFVSTVGKWLRAQGILLLITMGELLTGFLLLRVPYALLLAGAAALLDALPMIGVGLILLPWGLISFFTGATSRGIGLLILYAVTTLVRGLIEPKIVGAQTGQHPLLTLITMYIGFRVFGVPGMILCPILTIILRQTWNWF